MFTRIINRLIGLSEAQKDALASKEAIDRMWAEAFPVCAGCGLDRYDCPTNCAARIAGGWER